MENIAVACFHFVCSCNREYCKQENHLLPFNYPIEDNFFLSLILHIIKLKRTPLGHRSTVFLEKTRFITFIYRTVRKDVYRKCLQSRCFGTVTSSKMAVEIDAILDLLKVTIHQKKR